MASTTQNRRESDRKRSCSPHDVRSSRDAKRHRSRSPGRRHHHHHHHSHRSSETPRISLPFGQSSLHKQSLDDYRSLLADYLDLQKCKDITVLDEDEVKGRWKSFLGKWNRGELAEGWYDPATKQKADGRARDLAPAREDGSLTSTRLEHPPANRQQVELEKDDSDDDEDDGYGPALPSGQKAGPYIPSLQDLQHRQELSAEDRQYQRADLRYKRQTDRNAQKERLEELVPRADPGSRERQLEKKREATATNRSFADAKDSGTAEVPESDLMGEGGVEEYKAQLKANEKRKNEREIRKEEVLRARAAERDDKLAAHRRKEDKTMEMLRSLAQQRYGGGGA